MEIEVGSISDSETQSSETKWNTDLISPFRAQIKTVKWWIFQQNKKIINVTFGMDQIQWKKKREGDYDDLLLVEKKKKLPENEIEIGN